MKIIVSEDVIPVDVDQTLILSKGTDVNAHNATVDILDPVTGKHINMLVHEPMVRLVREQRQRGSFIIVWSKGGYEWATNVIKALQLEDCVDIIMSKPKTYFDDLDIKDWLKDRVYLEPKSNYKQ